MIRANRFARIVLRIARATKVCAGAGVHLGAMTRLLLKIMKEVFCTYALRDNISNAFVALKVTCSTPCPEDGGE